ncbi:membrane protease YdiL (CAAX protease family) [Streptomonospora nanhaiensis]|uniref:Membrane protease YdiL (CAAX protease family) n=1 Tax=Streptomonospora nanhaiensis TaxID=1323731 RepID=A0A853BKQ1_9ACTN|nr:membrane protease YdiL (CAAX protease family) [Streptomonospora nanhaiensis]
MPKTTDHRPPGRRAASPAVLVAGLLLLGASVAWLVLSGATEIRYTADHSGTVPVWHRWVPALVGLLLVRLVPPRLGAVPPAIGSAGDRAPRLQAAVLAASALLFAVALGLLGGGEPAHTVLKLVLLLAVPLVLFRLTRPAPRVPRPARERAGAWRRYGPLVPVAAWFALTYTGPSAVPPSDYAAQVDVGTLLVTVVVVFAVNSLLEEVFYRRWLQSRWERLLGPWPAIVLSSLLWASWHVAIQGTGHLPTDLASAFANQGVQGLFLGYLWSRYRMMWPLLAVHGAVNAVPVLLGLL